MEHESSDNKKVFIDVLNDDCLMHIFQFLPISDKINAEKVCKHWKAMSLESWRTTRVLDFSGGKSFKRKFMNDISLCDSAFRELLLRCGRFLTQLSLSEFHFSLPKDILNTIGPLCPNLTDVDLKDIKINSSDINALAKNYKNITKFIMGTASDNLEDELCDFFSKQKNLEYLKIIGTRLSGKCLTFLSAETMRTLILDSHVCICERYFSKVLERLGGLEKLILYRCSTLGEYTLESISKYCKNLKVLHLEDFRNIVNNSLKFTNLIKLENVSLLGFRNWVSYDNIANMALNCRELTDIDITGCDKITNDRLTSIAALPKLERLNINYIRNITDQGLCHFHYLKVLKCRASKITDEGLSVVLTSSPELRLLDISECVNVSTRILDIAKKVCNGRANNVVLKMLVGTSLFSNIRRIMSDSDYSSCDGCNVIVASPFLRIVSTHFYTMKVYRNFDSLDNVEQFKIDTYKTEHIDSNLQDILTFCAGTTYDEHPPELSRCSFICNWKDVRLIDMHQGENRRVPFIDLFDTRE